MPIFYFLCSLRTIFVFNLFVVTKQVFGLENRKLFFKKKKKKKKTVKKHSKDLLTVTN